MIGKKTLNVFLAVLFPVAFVHVASDVHRFASGYFSDKKWTTRDLREMSRSKTMSAAVSYVTSAQRETAKKALNLDAIKSIIDTTSAAEIRSAILTATSKEKRKIDMTMNSKIADFATTVNPAATCATADTAGGHGLDACVNICEYNYFVPAQMKRKAACHLMCMLATEPCTKESWGTMANDLTAVPRNWITMKMEKGRTRIEEVCARVTAKTVVAFLVLVTIMYSLYVSIESHALKEHTLEVKRRSEAEQRALVKLKASHILVVRANLVKRRAFSAWHDNAAVVTFHEAKREAGLRILEGVFSRRRMAPRLELWKAATAAMAIDEID